MVLGIFKIVLRLRDQYILIWKSLEILNIYYALTLRRIFLENENFSWKIGVPFLVESNTIESATFPYKTALSKANAKTNRTGYTKWTYYKEWSFATNYFQKFYLVYKSIL